MNKVTKVGKNSFPGKHRQNSFQEQAASLKGIRNAADLDAALDEWDDDDFVVESEPKADYRFTKD